MSAATTPVEVPDIGDFDDVPVIEILVSVGDTVAAEDPLVTLESDKATMDVPAPFGGRVSEVSVSVGDQVSRGHPLMVIERLQEDDDADGAEPTAAPAEATEPEPAEATAPAEATERAEATGRERAPGHPNGGGPIYASPSARRLARERHVDLGSVSGSGRKGRITKDDVQRLADGDGPAAPSATGPVSVAPGLAPWPSVEFAKFGPVERVGRTRIQRIAGAQPGAQLGDDPARHPQRRGRHHRARGVAQAAQRPACVRGREVHDGVVPGQGVRGRAEAVPGLQLVPGRRRAGAQALLQTSASPPTPPVAWWCR